MKLLGPEAIAGCLYVIIGAVTPAHANRLCGISYGNTRELERSLDTSDRLVSTGEGIRSIYDRGTRTTWWFPQSEHPAYPMAACIRQEVKENGGLVRRPVQSDCSGANPKACAAVADALAHAKM